MAELKPITSIEEISSTKPKLKNGCLNHSFFDWLTILSTLFVPLVVGILTIVLPLQQQNLSDRQNENSKTIALNNRLQEMELLQDQQKQIILNVYEHDLCDLLFKYSSIKHLNDTGSSNEDNEDKDDDDDDDERVSLVIRTKTLHALRQLDPARKILLIQLLIDSGVQNRINISHADLSSLIFPSGSFYNQLQFVNVIARKIQLHHVYLYQSNFSYSILDESSFYESNCSYADFSYASLQRTNWTNTDVTQAIFNYTNLLGATITPQQLATVQSLQGAILPNGSTAIMMIYERNNGSSSNSYLTFDTGKTPLNLDYHSIALNNQETRLLLVGNHDLAFINFETISAHIDNTINGDSNTLIPFLTDTRSIQLFDTCNINRPIVEWHHSDPNQYAVAIDRLVRFYTVDQSGINETNAIIDSQHQRPISTMCHSPHDPCWLLTGSLDGQIQVWDTRQCSSKSPASLKFTVSTPFSIRRIQWSSIKSDQPNQLAVQCDRCIRIYDIRRTDSVVVSFIDLEHTQRITSMDWTKQSNSIATLSMDQSMRIFSTKGHVIAESLLNEQSSCTSSKIRATAHDNLFVCASRDTMASTYGFIGWRWDEDQYLRPLTDRIISTTPSAIVDFCCVTNARFLNLFNNFPSSRVNDDSSNRFLLLSWCRDGQLCLVDMDSIFRQAWNNQQIRTKPTSLSDSSSSIGLLRTSSNLSRQQQMSRSSSTMMTMDSIKDETIDADDDDNAFRGMSVSPPNTMESSATSDENDYLGTFDQDNPTVTDVSVENELNSVEATYGDYITVEAKDEKRRLCMLRCKYSLDDSLSFRIYLILSRHYPIISQLFVRFKLSTMHHDERLKSFQSHIQMMFDETSYNCFYHGQLCLHKCLLKLKNLFDLHHKEEKSKSTSATTVDTSNRKRDSSVTNSEIDSASGLTNGHNINPNANNNSNSNRNGGRSSSSTRTSDSQISGLSLSQGNRRTCGARFSGGMHLICFGKISTNQQLNTGQILSALTDGTLSRPQSLPMRSASMTVTKSRENSSSVEQSSYRPPTTSTMQIQQTSNTQRIPMFSAPVRSSLGTSVFNDHPRISSYRRSLAQSFHPYSTVSIYDVSILLPVSRKLAEEYKIDFNNPMYMCEENEHTTQEMGKDDLTHCWRLLGGLLSIQPSLQNNDTWFQTPIAQGLIKHLVSNYVINGDIQSASMFLLTMSQTPYLKTKIQSKLVNEHDYDPVLYAYACLLHRWKHFYGRTQILSQIDYNCQSPAPFNQTITLPTNIICSICLQPVLGQHFLCANCGHGGHLKHMHEWFSSEEPKHRICPEKDCICRCILKQQELLSMNTGQIQQPVQTIPSRGHFGRQSSGGIRPL